MNTYWTTELRLLGTGMALLGGAVSGVALALAVVGQFALGPGLWLPMLIGMGVAVALYLPTLAMGRRGALVEVTEMVAHNLSLLALAPGAAALAAILTILALP